MDKTLFNALISYFKAERIKVSHSELELQLFSHPHTPSLYAVSETLNFLNINNVAAQIDQNRINELPEHFLAFLDDPERGAYFSHVRQNGSKVYLNADKVGITKEEFGKKWNGIILLAEQEKNSTISQSKWMTWSVIPLALLFTLLLWPNFYALGFFLMGMVGLFISNEIFETSQDRSTNFGKKICGQKEESGCNKILKSQNYNLGAFSLNDLLFAFFLSTMGLLLLNVGLGYVHLITYLVALVFVVSTILIQAFVLKAWCRLCLLSSSIIIVQASLILGLLYPLNIALSDGATVLLKDGTVLGLLFFSTLLVVHSFRKLKSQNYALSLKYIELLQFKRSPETINRALMDTKELTATAGAEQLIFGNPNVEPVIVLVLSTSCGFCKNAFEKFLDLYHRNGLENSFKLVLNHYDGASSKRNDVAATMIHSYRTHGADEFLKMMDDWFKHRNTDQFLREHAAEFTDVDYQILAEHREWCKKNELFYTPILIVSNKIIPHYYDATFLDDILEAIDTDQDQS
ncbi:vitamin K epoxide reductase family protein [Ulvibacterium sp.]|uniref:vitamin K epoxide reductase family protein n=1 Tax=Ulvibacterium sp. TaxID=2665914 RepID=UPI003BA86995